MIYIYKWDHSIYFDIYIYKWEHSIFTIHPYPNFDASAHFKYIRPTMHVSYIHQYTLAPGYVDFCEGDESKSRAPSWREAFNVFPSEDNDIRRYEKVR